MLGDTCPFHCNPTARSLLDRVGGDPSAIFPDRFPIASPRDGSPLRTLIHHDATAQSTASPNASSSDFLLFFPDVSAQARILLH
jgi:hypothetical protein